MKWLKRLTVIVGTFYRYRLAGLCVSLMGSGWICALLKMMPQSSKLKNEPPAVRLRLALESLADFHQVRAGFVHTPRFDSARLRRRTGKAARQSAAF